MLGVHVQHFQNLYNAEFRNGYEYCCCDISYMDVHCVADLTDLNVAACTSECEQYFEIRFEVCFADGTCSMNINEPRFAFAFGNPFHISAYAPGND